MNKSQTLLSLFEGKWSVLAKYSKNSLATLEREISRSNDEKYKKTLEFVLGLLVEMEKKVSKGQVTAISEFRKKYLKQTGGVFDTVVRESIAQIYDDIAAAHGMEDIANTYWS